MEAVIRILPYSCAGGPANMAADEVLVRSAAEGVASLRFYGWTAATLSVGYFQAAAVRLTDPRLAALPFVRRPSGGATLVHHHEFTYALALPFGPVWHSVAPWMQRMHRIITTALAELGLANRIEAVSRHPIKHGEVLCFQQYTTGDLLCGGMKVVGSAQRKYHQALLQHGSILLAQSEYTSNLPGIYELTGITLTAAQISEKLLHALTRDTGWRVHEADWTPAEKALIQEFVVEKYATAAWNERR